MTLIAELLVSALIVVGGLFALVGSFGLVKLPTLMMRLHGPTKATTLGVGGTLLASIVYFPVFRGDYSAHELLIALFLFLTAPITANMVAKAHLHRTVRDGVGETPAAGADPAPPLPGRRAIWATLRRPVELGGKPVSRSGPTSPRRPEGSRR